MNRVTFAVLAVLLIGVSANAAPIVTMTQSTVGAFNALDFFYSSSAGAEFTNYNLTVQSSTGADIQDPVKAATSDATAATVDTWMNTVYSRFGLGAASYQFTAYKPTGIGSNTPPVALINWDVFDTGDGDTNSFDPGTGTVSAPFHLARVLVSPTGAGTAVFTAYDTLSQGVGTPFTFSYGGQIPEPATLGLLGLALVGGLGIRRR